MEFVFWQSILSIHQTPFLNALSQNNSVTLVVERDIDEERRKTGWEIPFFKNCNVIIAPSDLQLDEIINSTSSAFHVLSGINQTFKNYKLTRKLTSRKYKVISYLEPYNWIGKKGILRKCKYKFLQLKFGNTLTAILPTGELGVKEYKNLGFKNIFEWGYFTRTCSLDLGKIPVNDTPKFLFVGSLDERKNILSLLNIFTKGIFENFTLSIIGTGPLSNEVEKICNSYSNINYLGTKSNDEVLQIMQSHDILILPSVFDGWGAVVNEALFNGMRVIASNHCGASCLLKESWRGSVFQFEKPEDLEKTILYQNGLGPQTIERRKRNNHWSEDHISGEKATEYFLSICSFLQGETNVKPFAPW